jgi:hypothetical protein
MMSKNKTGLNCTGSYLPRIATIEISGSDQLDDFCSSISTGDEILLYEKLSPKKTRKNLTETYYWMILEADEYPISVCELEKYANSLTGKWIGRRADYLVIGSYSGNCFLLVIELRHALVKENREDEKFEQLKESIEILIQNHLPIIQCSQALASVYEDPDDYKIIGAIIAPGNTRSFARGELNKNIEIADHKVAIRTLPKDALTNCKITWTELLRKLGVRVS